MIEAKASNLDSQPRFFTPYSKDVNPRLVQPPYQVYFRDEPRFFNHEQKEMALERQGYVCPMCGESIGIYGSECHHCVQWIVGGSSSIDNLVVVHKGTCHRQADALGKRGDMVVGGTIFDAEPSQRR